MKTLYVDMDGVICCFESGIRALEPDVEWTGENIDRICESNPRIFLSLPEIKGSTEALNFLKNHFDVYFASTPMWNVPHSWMDKRIYLFDRFPWAEKKLILTHNKGLLRGDFIIDDRTVHGVDSFQGKHIHFGTNMFPNWETVINYLMKKV